MRCPKCGNRRYTESQLGNKFCLKPWCGELFPVSQVFERRVMKLFEKLLEIRKSVAYLQKENKNKQQGFNYVSSSQVLGAVREKMNELGVFLKAQVTEAQVHPPREGAKQWLTELHMLFTWVDVESDERIDCTWYAQGCDMAEKGPGKAQTYAEKMFILKTFNIPTDKEDPDAYEAKQERSKQSSGQEGVGSESTTGAQETGELPKSLTEGMKLLKGKRVTVGDEKKSLADAYKKFVAEMAGFKRALGEEKYYLILGDVGNVEKSIHVLDYGVMMDLFKAMREAQASG